MMKVVLKNSNDLIKKILSLINVSSRFSLEHVKFFCQKEMFNNVESALYKIGFKKVENVNNLFSLNQIRVELEEIDKYI